MTANSPQSLPETPFKSQVFSSRSGFAKGLDVAFIALTAVCAFAIGCILLAIAVQVAAKAWPAISKFGLGFLTSQSWDPVREIYGALPMIYGTLVTAFFALLFAVPIGVGTAIFLSEDYLPPSLRTALIFLIELLAAIPSVVYGIWGIVVLIPFLTPIGDWLHQNFWLEPLVKIGSFSLKIPLFSTMPIGPGLLPSILVLTVMILPIITAISRDSLAALPPDLRQASLGLGATRWETILRVLLPAAFSGIVGAVILALGRAMGETMAVTMLIGSNNQISASLLDTGNTIASLLANQFAEASGLQVSALMYAGFVLFVLTLIVNVFAELVVAKVKNV
jgi:phosphate transport system permease protein